MYSTKKNAVVSVLVLVHVRRNAIEPVTTNWISVSQKLMPNEKTILCVCKCWKQLPPVRQCTDSASPHGSEFRATFYANIGEQWALY